MSVEGLLGALPLCENPLGPPTFHVGPHDAKHWSYGGRGRVGPIGYLPQPGIIHYDDFLLHKIQRRNLESSCLHVGKSRRSRKDDLY